MGRAGRRLDKLEEEGSARERKRERERVGPRLRVSKKMHLRRDPPADAISVGLGKLFMGGEKGEV